MYEIVCKICGKHVMVRNKHYCTCSEECRKIRTKLKQKSYRSDPNRIEIYKELRRKHYYANYSRKISYCKICGEQTDSRKRYHEDCVINKAVEGILNGQTAANHNTYYRQKNKDVLRALNIYGYSIEELKDIIRERDK